VTDNKILQTGSWRKLIKEAKKQDLYLFGTGKACKVFIDRWKNKVPIRGVFDNSPTKWGSYFEGYQVLNPEEINTRKDIVILITTTSYMDDIAIQLDGMGFCNYYGLAVLESKSVLTRLVAELTNIVLWKLLPVKKKRILFSNGFKKYGDNAKAIIDKLIEEQVNCEILWISPDPTSTYPKEVKLINNDVISKIIAHATSKVWVDNYKKELWIRKKRSQIYINTWHGSVSLKKLDFDTKLSSQRHLKRTLYDSKLIDVRLSNSEYCTKMYRRAMKYEGGVLKCGSPRLDKCFQKNYSFTVREKLEIPQSAKIVLYAPTWRTTSKTGFQGTNKLTLDLEILKDYFREQYKDEVYVLVKLHPSAKSIRIPQSEFIKDVRNWEDVYELLIEADALISDYSSLIFEMGFLYKPVYLYLDDFVQYKQEHGVYMEPDEMPYPYAFTQEELEKKIKEFKRDEYEKQLRWFNEKKLQITETGTATKQVIDRIQQYIGE